MDPIIQEAKDLVKADDGFSGLVVGRKVYSPHTFDSRIPDFTAQQYVFLRHYRLGVPLEEAATQAGLTPEAADAFLSRPKVVAWLQDRAIKDYIKNEWAEPGKWWKEGDDVLKGHKEFTKIKLEIWKEFGQRVAPLKREVHQPSAPKIEINIDPSAVQDAFRRQNAIEADIVKEGPE